MLHVAGHDRGDLPAAVQGDVDDEIAAGHPGDSGVLFVDRVAVENPAIGVGMFEQFRAVPALDGLERSDSWTDQLTATGVAGHQVGLDQTGGDLQVGTNVSGVDPSGDSAGGRADERVLFQAGAVVILDAITGYDLGAEHLLLLGGSARAM